ncbi:hypothetical protein [Rhizobium sp. CF142]|uniref:hypothetical protein n=1 Tax=Rhizobium sp. CF142 TaxID=1144314 RepID=UPI00026EF804|nr:hypothetical protein [Rhizobium sp. CF142]EJJ28844.1 hypothetical protein PMI11_02927 [Rhizobium sp. CF142]
MSIEGHSTAPGANVIVEHYCCVPECGKWGGFGFSAGKVQETRWWCWEHYLDAPLAGYDGLTLLDGLADPHLAGE